MQADPARGVACEPCGCHVCREEALEEVAAFPELGRVASDCRPWPAGGRLAICRHCGTVQKCVDAAWRRETAQLYAGYRIFHQSGGADQAIFDPATGDAAPRSAHVLRRLLAEYELPDEGRLLDVGCGAGTLLRAFGLLRPRWRMVGCEQDETNAAAIRAIAGVETFHTEAPSRSPGLFDLVTLSHVLEHVEDPRSFLAGLAPTLGREGLLLVQVPSYRANPVDLLIADHCSHFDESTLRSVLESSGFEVLTLATDWVIKELTAVARPGPRRSPVATSPDPDLQPFVARSLGWLGHVVEHAGKLAESPQFGIFGTSIWASWLFGCLDGRVGFFVDEDPHRIHRDYLGRPVHAPSEVPDGADVLVLLAPALAEPVATRLARTSVRFHLPPRFGG